MAARSAVEDFTAATRLDSTFVLPLIWTATVSSPAAADSFLRAAARSRERLAPADRYLLDVAQAANRGDWSAALQAAREMARVAPASGVALVMVGGQGGEPTALGRPSRRSGVSTPNALRFPSTPRTGTP